GLHFRERPRPALRSKEQVRTFLLAKLGEEFPPERIRGVSEAYRLLGLIPDSLDLQDLLLDLYSEQVAGFYDPDSSALFAGEGADPAQLRLVVAHELVHALQDQYLPLDSLLKQRTNGDRASAAQAILEGHATIASLKVLVPDEGMIDQSDFWQNFRSQIRESQATMDVFQRAPLVLREGLVFPYLYGADFMRWWAAAHPGVPLPSAAELPSSTEQILHPERYNAGDRPVELAFTDSAATPLHEDTLGEMELHILGTSLRGGEVITSLAAGWGGDRYRVYDAPEGTAMVWWSVWDSETSARRFRINVANRLVDRGRAGYRLTADSVQVEGRPAARVVIAPPAWGGWQALPGVQLREK
ncbi:MAG: hypothetical protein KJZ47_03875, partial [Gemmatimonadales bacterium]|nr:hypothetical protein [Gemmatimonadales bacterium]